MKIVYINCAGEGMNEDAVWDFVIFWGCMHPELRDWDFIDITGGVSEFLDEDIFWKLKKRFDARK